MNPKVGAVNFTSSISTIPTNDERILEGGGKFCNKTGRIAKAILIGCEKYGIGSYCIEFDGYKIHDPTEIFLKGFSGRSNLTIVSDWPLIELQFNGSSYYFEKRDDYLRSFTYKPEPLTLEEAKEKIPSRWAYDHIAFNRHGIFVNENNYRNYFICRNSRSGMNDISDFKNTSIFYAFTGQGHVSFKKSNDEYFINGEPTTRWPDSLQGS